MLKTSIGELKLSPIKEEGKFVFFNDFITINGKVSKGDKIKIFVPSYQASQPKILIPEDASSSAILVVRGQQYRHDGLTGFDTMNKLYDHVSTLYKDRFYFGDKA
ncbi:MAG: hypothetical protein JST82_13320 [Bacteroidetes bacterium]|nr:hypothetical protein [Bacteroidota bacterium]